MNDDTELGEVTAKMAENGITDPELYETVSELERKNQRVRLEAARKRKEEQSLVGQVIREIASQIEPEDLAPLLKVGMQALYQAKTGNGDRSVVDSAQRDRAEPDTSQSSPAKETVNGIRDQS